MLKVILSFLAFTIACLPTPGQAQSCVEYRDGARLIGSALLEHPCGGLIYADGHLFIESSIDGEFELGIFDLSDPDEPRRLGAWTSDESIRGPALIAGFAYLFTGYTESRLITLDVRNPAQPVPVPTPDLTDEVHWLQAESGILYTSGRDSLGQNEFRAYRPDESGVPRLLGALPSRASDEPPFACDGLLFTFDESLGIIKILDFTDPTAPFLGGECLPAMDGLTSVTKLGSILYAATHDLQGVMRWDVSDPTHPEYLGNQHPLSFQAGISFHLLTRMDDRIVGFYGDHGMMIMSQEPTGLLAVDGVLPCFLKNTSVVAVAGTSVHVVMNSPGYLRTYDLARPRTIPPLASLDQQQGFARDLTSTGHRTYVLYDDGDTKLAAWDISDPTLPEPLGHWTLPSTAFRIAVDGDILMTSSSDGGSVDVYTLGPDGEPFHEASLTTDQRQEPPVLDGSLSALLSSDQVQLIDVGDPDLPIVGTIVHATTVRKVALGSGTLAILDSQNITLYDVSEADAPVYLGTAPLIQDGDRQGAACVLDGDYAYVSQGDSILVYASHGGAPQRVAAVRVPYIFTPERTLDLRDATLYASNQTRTAVVDVSDPSSPQLLGMVGSRGSGSLFIANDRSLVEIALISSWPWKFQLHTYPLQCTDAAANDPVADPAEDVPAGRHPRILSTHPNPFNPRVDLAFMIPQAEPAVVDVVDLAGRRVAELWDAPLPVGPWRTSWDGRDRHGRNLAAGPYLVRIRTEQGTDSRTITLVR